MGALKGYDTIKAMYEDLNLMGQNENKETKGIKVEILKRQRVIWIVQRKERLQEEQVQICRMIGMPGAASEAGVVNREHVEFVNL